MRSVKRAASRGHDRGRHGRKGTGQRGGAMRAAADGTGRRKEIGNRTRGRAAPPWLGYKSKRARDK